MNLSGLDFKTKVYCELINSVSFLKGAEREVAIASLIFKSDAVLREQYGDDHPHRAQLIPLKQELKETSLCSYFEHLEFYRMEEVRLRTFQRTYFSNLFIVFAKPFSSQLVTSLLALIKLERKHLLFRYDVLNKVLLSCLVHNNENAIVTLLDDFRDYTPSKIIVEFVISGIPLSHNIKSLSIKIILYLCRRLYTSWEQVTPTFLNLIDEEEDICNAMSSVYHLPEKNAFRVFVLTRLIAKLSSKQKLA